MAVTFIQQKKTQRMLIIVLLGAIASVGAVLWWGFFFAGGLSPANVTLPSPKKIELQADILSHPVLQELDEPREATVAPQGIGRDNPFLPAP